MRFVIYVDDHEPAHVHVYGDGEARINILTGEIMSNRRMSRRDLARALTSVLERKAEFLAAWERQHG
ncbi:DUF4160 domain-containing protein [Aureimonas jatrophae]|uniref:DUF4160 domain-containing protein n=1 Tax=Aureimonas jatrophae TaxID=1166073 RepID=A0A1H0N0T6_9HYPH|nr:protein of unknown function [Aureimonas jatrophae]